MTMVMTKVKTMMLVASIAIATTIATMKPLAQRRIHLKKKRGVLVVNPAVDDPVTSLKLNNAKKVRF